MRELCGVLENGEGSTHPTGSALGNEEFGKRSESVRVQQLREVVRLADGLIPRFHRRNIPRTAASARRTGFGQLETKLMARDRVHRFTHPLRDRLSQLSGHLQGEGDSGRGRGGVVRPQYGSINRIRRTFEW